jgi:hypothetical protein
MAVLQISPSKLEQLRLHLVGAFNETITKEKVIDYIKGLSVVTAKMDWGEAFHAVIENGPEQYLKSDGSAEVRIQSGELVRLEPSDVIEAIKYRQRFIPGVMINEVEQKLKFELLGHSVIMKMRIDGLYGTEVHERKTTSSSPTWEKYGDSIQWRCYAVATGCTTVYYDVFERKSNGLVIPHVYKYLPYAGIKDELVRSLKQFIKFCEHENLLTFLKPKHDE